MGRIGKKNRKDKFPADRGNSFCFPQKWEESGKRIEKTKLPADRGNSFCFFQNGKNRERQIII